MAADLVVRSTRVLGPSGIAPAALHLVDGRIARLASYDDYPPGIPVDDAGDLVVMPGLVDTHVHFNEPGRTDWEGFATGTAAAAAGGVTTVVDMPLNSVPATTDLMALGSKRAATAGKLHVDVAFWGGVVPGNTPHLSALAASGVAGFKAFMVPSGVDEFPSVGESDLREAMPVLAKLGLPLLVHAESPAAIEGRAMALASGDPTSHATWLASRPPSAELDAIELLVSLCREYRCRIHIVHLSASAALPLLDAARAERLPVTVETCPHYLTFAAEDVPAGATPFKCAPPIRGRSNQRALWQALRDGAIDLIASDHSPCPPSMKQLSRGDFVRAWGGIGSLELALPAVWTGALTHGVSLERIAHLMCTAPATLAGLGSRKGRIAEHFNADLVIWNPDADFPVVGENLIQRHKISPYHGLRLRGVVERTYVRGRLAYRRGDPAWLSATHGRMITADRS
jgi:allantoinase